MELTKDLQKCLDKIAGFSPAEVAEILSLCSYKEIPKGDHLLRPFAISNAIQFLIDGEAIHFNGVQEEQGIFELYIKHDCMVCPASFFSQQPSSHTIKAFSSCRILTLTIHSIHGLLAKSPAYFKLGKVLQPGWFKADFFDQDMSPDQKYNHLLTHKPRIIQRFPLKYIASYLKITPETLSRVRARTGIS